MAWGVTMEVVSMEIIYFMETSSSVEETVFIVNLFNISQSDL